MNPQDPENNLIFKKAPSAWIQEICDKFKTSPSYSIVSNERPHVDPADPDFTVFTAKLTIELDFKGKMELTAIGSASTKKAAKQCAAIAMLNRLGVKKDDLPNIAKAKNIRSIVKPKKSSPNVSPNSKTSKDAAGTGAEANSAGPQPPGELEPGSSSSSTSGTPQELTEFDRRVASNENLFDTLEIYCRLQGLEAPVFDVLSRKGPPNAPFYKIRCVIEGHEELVQPFMFRMAHRGSLQFLKQYMAGVILFEIQHNPDRWKNFALKTTADLNRFGAISGATRNYDILVEALITRRKGRAPIHVLLVQRESVSLESNDYQYLEDECDQHPKDCKCSLCAAAPSTLRRELRKLESLLEVFCNLSRVRGHFACAWYRYQYWQSEYICHMKLQVGLLYYLIREIGKTPKHARKLVLKEALALVTSGIFERQVPEL